MSFKKYNPLINAYAQQGPSQLSNMVAMVVLSIQQPWHSVGAQLVDYKQHGLDSRFVWGNKRKTIEWLQQHEERLYREAMDALLVRKAADRDHALMQAFLQVDGLGLAKAGFCCQLFAGRVGCIDVHNLRRLNIAASVLSFSKTLKPDSAAKRIDAYVAACKQRGTGWLWDSWCSLIAKKQPSRWRDGEHVSLVHYEYLKALDNV